jgi:hypothetical protein
MSTQINDAMLVKLTLRALVRSAKNDRMSRDTAAREHMSEAAVSVRQELLPIADLKAAGITSVSDLIATQGKLSKLRVDHTMPWSQDGWRILPACDYDAYVAKANPLIEELAMHRDRVADEWVSRILPVCQAAHNGNFRPELYPPATTIRAKIRADIQFQPLTTDFRCAALSSMVAAQLKQQAESRVQAAIAANNLQLGNELVNHLNTLAERLANPEGRITDAIISNVTTLLERMPSLNLNNDPMTHAIWSETHEKLKRIDTKMLKANDTIRSSVASIAAGLATRHARKLSAAAPAPDAQLGSSAMAAA